MQHTSPRRRAVQFTALGTARTMRRAARFYPVGGRAHAIRAAHAAIARARTHRVAEPVRLP